MSAVTAPAGGVRTDVVYNDAVRKFTIATIFWGVVGFFVSVLIASQLAFPALNVGLRWAADSRRPHNPTAAKRRLPGPPEHQPLYESRKKIYPHKISGYWRRVKWAALWALCCSALARFLWALRSGQFDNRDGAASRIVSDDDDSSCQSIGSRGASRWDCE